MAGLEAGHLAKLAGYPFVVISWVDDAGYPLSVATAFEGDQAAGTVSLAAPAGEAIAVPTDREVNLLGSHIRPTPGQGYDERRYVQLWGHASEPVSGRITFTPTHAWGWDEAEIPFFEYSERSVPQSRRYLAQLSEEQGRTVRPRLSLGWLLLRTTRLPFLSATFVPVLLGIAVAARHGSFNWWLALVTIIGASFAHLGINVSNDIFDTLSGADDANVNPTQFSGGSRVLIYDLLTLRQLVALDLGLFGGAAAIGLFLVWATASQTLLPARFHGTRQSHEGASICLPRAAARRKPGGNRPGRFARDHPRPCSPQRLAEGRCLSIDTTRRIPSGASGRTARRSCLRGSVARWSRPISRPVRRDSR